MNFFVKLKQYLEGEILGSYKQALKNGLKSGKGVSIMTGVSFGTEPYLITLEDEVRVSINVSFVTHDGGTWAFRDLPEYVDVIKFGKIHVGSRTFIGCNSIIMPGVTIGKRCVIGAGSVVTKDIPDGCVAAGVPARVITTTEEYAKKCKDSCAPYDKAAYLRDKRAFLETYLK